MNLFFPKNIPLLKYPVMQQDGKVRYTLQKKHLELDKTYSRLGELRKKYYLGLTTDAQVKEYTRLSHERQTQLQKDISYNRLIFFFYWGRDK